MFTRFRSVYRFSIRLIHQNSESEPQSLVKKIEKPVGSITYELLDKESIETAIDNIAKSEPKSVLEKCDEDVSYISSYLKPTFNLAAYVNKSETLQELLKLGVDLYKVEKQKDVPQYIAQLEFEKDVKEHVMFLYSLGLQVDEIGKFITKYPLIFKESLDDLRVRINYLKYKKFNDEMILRIVERNPFWLQYRTPVIDEKLGFFQKTFNLTGSEVRTLTCKNPKLITYNIRSIKVNNFVLKEEMGFTPEEIKTILLKRPGIFMKRQENLLETFNFLHGTMKVTLEEIAKNPQILTCRHHRLKERYLFLQKLNRVQFDPKLPNFVSLTNLVSGNDSYFATEIAKSSIQVYNEFLKSL